jgi:hypothetical protein
MLGYQRSDYKTDAYCEDEEWDDPFTGLRFIGVRARRFNRGDKDAGRDYSAVALLEPMPDSAPPVARDTTR